MTARTALITGASSGIGRALALHYARRDGAGAHLVLLGRDPARLDAVAAECRGAGASTETLRIDVRDRPAMRDALLDVDARTPIDILVANAGIATGVRRGALLEDPDAVRAVIDIDLVGVFNTVEPLIEPMCARGRGRIAMTGSIAGVRGLPHSPSYCAVKAAVHVYGQSLGPALRRRGVSVSVIVPGFVKTPMLDRLSAMKPLTVSDARAAAIIARGLDRGQPTIAFPRLLYWTAQLSRLLPPAIEDAILQRIKADVPGTYTRIAP